MTVPTMRELKKAAAAIGASITIRRGTSTLVRIIVNHDYGWKFTDAAKFYYHATSRRLYRRARYLAGEHIEALKRMQEAGL